MRKLLLFVLFSGYVLMGSAQVVESNEHSVKNVVKFLPATLPFNSVSFEYERMLNPKNALTLQIGFPRQQSVIGKYGITGNSDVKTAEFGTTILRAAYRHYTGKKRLPKGFYIEPYLKYQHIKGDATIEGVDDQDIPYAGSSEIKLNTINMGCQFGVQFLIAKRVSLDLYFLGLEGGILSGHVDTTPTSSNTAYDPIILSVIKGVIEQKIADLPSSIGKRLTVTQTQSQVNVKASSTPYPWIRGGFSIGFAF